MTIREEFNDHSPAVGGCTDPAGENAGSASSQRNRDDSGEPPVEARR